MELTILGINQGNGNMKTASYVFPYGFKKQETKPYADVVSSSAGVVNCSSRGI